MESFSKNFDQLPFCLLPTEKHLYKNAFLWWYFFKYFTKEKTGYVNCNNLVHNRISRTKYDFLALIKSETWNDFVFPKGKAKFFTSQVAHNHNAYLWFL